ATEERATREGGAGEGGGGGGPQASGIHGEPSEGSAAGPAVRSRGGRPPPAAPRQDPGRPWRRESARGGGSPSGTTGWFAGRTGPPIAAGASWMAWRTKRFLAASAMARWKALSAARNRRVSRSERMTS